MNTNYQKSGYVAQKAQQTSDFVLNAMNQRVSVVLPAYNEGATILKSLERISSLMSSLGLNYELIVVDDGSTDNTRTEASRFHDPCVKVLGYRNNLGKGAALLHGLMMCTGGSVIFLDSDMEIDPSYLALFVKNLKDFDIVAGSKRHPESQVAAPLSRKFLSAAFHRLVVLATGVTVSDTQVGFKAFRAEQLKKMVPLLSVKKYAFDVELFTVARLLKLRIKELPVKMSLRSGFSMKSVLRMFVDLLGITYRLRILRWYQKNLNNSAAKYSPILKW